MAAYENHSRKRPAPVTDIFIPSRGCPLTRALTVYIKDSSSELSGVRNSEPIFCMGTIKDSSSELSGVRNSEPNFYIGTIKDSSFELSGVRDS